MPVGREGVLPRSKVVQTLRSDPIYEFLWSLVRVRVFSKIRYCDYEIFDERPISTQKSPKIESYITRKRHRNSQTRIKVTQWYLWTYESDCTCR